VKILHLAQFLGVGGLEKVLLLLIQEQLAAGHEVELVVYDHERAWVDKFRDLGISVDTSFTKSEGYDKKLLKYLNKKVQAYDVVHTHDLNPMMYMGPLKVFNFFNSHFPKIIHTTHGMEDIGKIAKIKLYEKLFTLRADSIVGVGPAICDFYLSIGACANKVHLINNGAPIPTTMPSPACNKDFLVKEFSLDANKFIWVYVARVFPLKDQKMLIEVFKDIPDAQLLLIGPASDQAYMDSIKKEIPDNVRITGGRDDIDAILSGSDFYISASHHEGIPISVLEASAHGLPCLLTDIPGHRSLAMDNLEVSLYFEVANSSQCIEQINNLMHNKDISEKLARSLHTIAAKYYSSHRMFLDYMKLYEAKND
jgi:glycosyltransferase involved in cell wall biosynthesis